MQLLYDHNHDDPWFNLDIFHCFICLSMIFYTTYMDYFMLEFAYFEMEMQLYSYYWYNRRKRRNIFPLHTNRWPHTFMAWNEHFNEAWRVTLINRAQTAPVSEMIWSSKCFLHVWKMPSSHITERTRIQLMLTLIFCKFNFCAKRHVQYKVSANI